MRIYLSDVREPGDVVRAIRWGASAVGIKTGYGKDVVPPELAREMFLQIPLFVSRVGIFNDEKKYHIQELATFCQLNVLHFTGNEEPEDLKRYSEHLIKDFSKDQLAYANLYPVHAVSVRLKEEKNINLEHLPQGKLLILSGNLCLESWERVVAAVNPFAVQIQMAEASEGMVRKLTVL